MCFASLLSILMKSLACTVCQDYHIQYDVKFTSYFWKTMCHKLRTKFQFTTIFHSQTDGQTEVITRSLGNLLRYLVGENLRIWNHLLSIAEFAYNCSINKIIGMSPLEVVHSYQPRQLINLIFMAYHHTRVSMTGASFAPHIHELHKRDQHSNSEK